MVLAMKENMWVVRRRERETILGEMVLYSLDHLRIIYLVVLDIIYGLMVNAMMENGRQVRCMVRENFNGQMEECMMENGRMTRKKDME